MGVNILMGIKGVDRRKVNNYMILGGEIILSYQDKPKLITMFPKYEKRGRKKICHNMCWKSHLDIFFSNNFWVILPF